MNREFINLNRPDVSYIFIILIVAAVITPPDVTSQIIVSIPLFVLYEVSIIIAERVEKNKLKAA